jgi:excisionase family DNA binding protein
MTVTKKTVAEPVKRRAYRVKEVCEALGISNAFFYDKLKEKKISVVYFGDSPRVTDDEFSRILREGIQ